MNYPWKNISPKDTLVLTKSTILSDLDLRILISLYQPLIGAQAVSLYHMLKEYIHENRSKEVVLSDIISQLNIGIKEYYEARIQLEAYGLLRIYRHAEFEDNYILSLERPATAHQFFSDPMLKMMLMEKVGERITKDLEERFLTDSVSVKGYKEITKPFGDVVHVNMEKMSQSMNQTVSPSLKRTPTLSEQVMQQNSFDWSFFLEGLNKHFVSTQSLDTVIKNIIYTFHTIYGINELEMQQFVLEAADVNTGEVTDTKLTRIIQQNYLNSTKNQLAPVSQEPEDKRKKQFRINELKQNGFVNEEIEIILHAEETQPFSYLRSIKQQKGGFVTTNETFLLKELVEQAPLPVSVINILINYILIIKNSAALEKNFALKIANDWAQDKIRSPEDAMKKVKELYASTQAKQENRNKPTPKKRYYGNDTGRKETLPEWATQKQSTDEKISLEEEEAFREKLKRIRSRKSGES